MKIQCCYCKSNKENNPHIEEYFNLEIRGEDESLRAIAHGCSFCKEIYNKKN